MLTMLTLEGKALQLLLQPRLTPQATPLIKRLDSAESLLPHRAHFQIKVTRGVF